PSRPTLGASAGAGAVGPASSNTIRGGAISSYGGGRGSPRVRLVSTDVQRPSRKSPRNGRAPGLRGGVEMGVMSHASPRCRTLQALTPRRDPRPRGRQPTTTKPLHVQGRKLRRTPPVTTITAAWGRGP